MKYSRVIVLSAALIGLTVSLFAAVYDISEAPTSNQKQKRLSVTTNDVILIQAPSGAVAVVQFTSFGASTASYRWRYRFAKSQPVKSGDGQVRESYERKRKAFGIYDVTPKADHDTTVRAGDIRIQWSYASTMNGWLYYYPSRATIQMLASNAFNIEL